MVWGLEVYTLYGIGSNQGLQIVTWSPQATVLILVVATGLVSCSYTL